MKSNRKRLNVESLMKIINLIIIIKQLRAVYVLFKDNKFFRNTFIIKSALHNFLTRRALTCIIFK